MARPKSVFSDEKGAGMMVPSWKNGMGRATKGERFVASDCSRLP